MPDLTPADRLKLAESAYQDLMTGNQVRVFVDQNGERVEYTAVKASDLYDYIVSLGGPSWAGASRQRSRPMRFVFGGGFRGGMPF